MTINHNRSPKAGSLNNGYGMDHSPKEEEDAYPQRSTHCAETNILTVERAREATAIEHNLSIKDAFRLVCRHDDL